jgi:hypothetical protein
MSKIIIGIDPDSKAHGVAVYIDGKIDKLECSTLVGIVGFIEFYANHIIEFHIEDVNAMNAVFRQRQGSNQNINMKMSNSVGKCQQAQIELERFITRYGCKIVKHKISKMWKKDKAQFEKVTGWTGRSNEDTRSAAYFGYLGLKR